MSEQEQSEQHVQKLDPVTVQPTREKPREKTLAQMKGQPDEHQLDD
jgi:hypothetical protein